MTISCMPAKTVRTLLVALLAATLAACGTQDGGNDSQVAGIEGTGIVSGFGSVYVNGIEFAVDEADIRSNGERVNEDALRVGDVVTLLGTIDANGNAHADRIVFDRVLDGPISRIDIRNGAGELVALGQTVVVDANTTFINTAVGRLSVGDRIAVSGIGDDSGNLRATSIEQGAPYRPGSTRVDIEGVVQALDGSRFRLGSLTVHYGPSEVDETAGTLRNGAFVEVFGTRAAGDEAPLQADTVTVRKRALGEQGERVFLEAVIRDYDGLGDFHLAGQSVDAHDAQRTDDTDVEPGNGVAVSVNGRLQDSMIVADSFAVQLAPSVILNAPLTSMDSRNNTLAMLGTDIHIRADTRYLDKSATRDRDLRLGRLAVGDTVDAVGYTTDAGLVVTRLARTAADPTGTASVRGPIERVERSGDTATWHVAGTRIVTRIGTTTFQNANGEPIDANTFLAEAAPGATMHATGPENAGRIDTARVAQLIR